MVRVVVFIFIIVKFTTSFALDMTPNGIYRATKEACLELADKDLNSSAYDRIAAGYFPTRDYTEMMTFIRSESFKKAINDFNFSENVATTMVLNQNDFHRAIAECAKDNKRLKQIFLDSVIRSDKAGKSLAIFIIFVGIKGWSSILKKFPNEISGYFINFHKYLVTFLGLSFLEGDSSKSNIQKIDHTQLIKLLENKKDHFQSIFLSIQAQIFSEQEKIERCGQCSDLEQLKVNREALIELLNAVDKSKAQENLKMP
ncbi:MAG: hypothetical protein L6Q37_14335 [Bdellovibrionaceae bacterium]|nr:hypothetical protein [Pseudobdellovibrionaceae bacterium]NUM57174.1 hypothetical protein [Pseudobdellovibrionaceae bacterium]